MSKCDSCAHEKVCGYKSNFYEFEKSKTSDEYPKPDIAFKEGSREFYYEAMEKGPTITFSVEVKCSQYREEKPIPRGASQQMQSFPYGIINY